jgi:O-antigen/teichoic acid export membrane protein
MFTFLRHHAQVHIEADTEATGLASRVRSAVFWRSGSQIAAQILMWTVTIIVVRLLDPHDYGLYFMSQVLLIALNFLNGQSFASSLIREENVTPHRIAQVFGILILMNLALAAAQFLAAPAMAAYYKQPLITDMLRAQSLLYLVIPFVALPQVLLARELNFKAQAKADFSGALADIGLGTGGSASRPCDRPWDRGKTPALAEL